MAPGAPSRADRQPRNFRETVLAKHKIRSERIIRAYPSGIGVARIRAKKS